MSWLFGVVQPSLSSKQKHTYRRIHAPELHSFETENIYVAAGGIGETCIFHTEGEEGGWAVVGSGLRRTDLSCEFLTRPDWRKILSVSNPDLSSLDGHFCILKWRKSEVECWTDEIGLRTLYIAPYEKGFCFSTRLPWVAQATGLSTPSFEELGSAWLLTNKLTYGSLVSGISRIGPGGYASISIGKLDLTNRFWVPEFSESTDSHMVEALESFVHPRVPDGTLLSLGLSGGFDCRLLLALLGSNKRVPFSLFTFGPEDHPDTVIAKKIAGALHFQLDRYNDPLPDVNDTVRLVKDFVSQTCLVSPSSAIVKLRYYGRMHERGRILIDGGYGEISRRQMGNRLLVRGRRGLQPANLDRIVQMMRQDRAAIFHAGVEQQMLAAAKREIADFWNEMPSVDEIGSENFVDLLSIRARVGNNSPGPQEWIDSQIRNYMPYAQPSFLREVFRTALRQRRNATLHRKVIRERYPQVEQFPLTKEGTTYPYLLPTVPAWIWRALQSKAGKKYLEPYTGQLLQHVREFVLDTLHDAEVRSFESYDYSRIVRLVEGYYNGTHTNATQVDWWLTFELWRRSLSGK